MPTSHWGLKFLRLGIRLSIAKSPEVAALLPTHLSRQVQWFLIGRPSLLVGLSLELHVGERKRKIKT